MSTTQNIKRFFIAVLALLFTISTPAVTAYADSFDDQIKAIQSEVNGYQDQASALSQQADTLQNKLDIITANERAIQAQIDLNQAQYDKLSQQIQDTQQRIDNQKQAIGQNIKATYLESSVTPLEMVASSKSISDFIDKQEYRNKIRDQIQQGLDKVKTLKAALTDQQKQLAGVLADQKNQEASLSDQEDQQNNLLAQTQGQEAAYQNLIGQKNSQIASLRAQQAAANRSHLGGVAVAGDPNHGGYPNAWAHAAQDSVVDNWGMLNRECVSYTAWKVYQSGAHMPYWGGAGNANQWPGNARAAGIPTGSTPKIHSVAIMSSGAYGHAMWVEAVSGDMITVSQYNYALDGQYSEMTINGSGLTYIYFQ